MVEKEPQQQKEEKKEEFYITKEEFESLKKQIIELKELNKKKQEEPKGTIVPQKAAEPASYVETRVLDPEEPKEPVYTQEEYKAEKQRSREEFELRMQFGDRFRRNINYADNRIHLQEYTVMKEFEKDPELAAIAKDTIERGKNCDYVAELEDGNRKNQALHEYCKDMFGKNYEPIPSMQNNKLEFKYASIKGGNGGLT